MTITFISNFMTHHQSAFCNEMYQLLGDDFHFIATKTMDSDRVSLGWHNESAAYIILAYKNEEAKQAAIKLINESQVVLTGGNHKMESIYLKERYKQNKLTLRYSERLFKTGIWHLLSPRAIYNILSIHTSVRHKNVYMLCASAYMPLDASIFFAYPQKLYKWGYFPEVKEYDIASLLNGKRAEKVKILWVGRFLPLKHTDAAIKTAKRLKEAGYNFSLEIIGSGEEEASLKALTAQYNLSDTVNFLGVMSPEAVREHMENASIFLFTSDFNEGWGAVVNEAMNSGCAVVASHASGAVPFLIKNGENGFIYKNGDINSLYKNVKKLIDSQELRERLGANAYSTLAKTWNAKVAAERLIVLSEALLKNGICDKYIDGPCSKAEVIWNNWFKES